MARANPFIRYGAGPSGHLEMPTWEIPHLCLHLCSWSVVRMAAGGHGPVSRLTYRNAACPAALHRQQPRAEEAS